MEQNENENLKRPYLFLYFDTAKPTKIVLQAPSPVWSLRMQIYSLDDFLLLILPVPAQALIVEDSWFNLWWINQDDHQHINTCC